LPGADGRKHISLEHLAQASIAVFSADAVLEPGLEELAHRRDRGLRSGPSRSRGSLLLGTLLLEVDVVASERLDARVFAERLCERHVASAGGAVRLGKAALELLSSDDLADVPGLHAAGCNLKTQAAIDRHLVPSGLRPKRLDPPNSKLGHS